MVHRYLLVAAEVINIASMVTKASEAILDPYLLVTILTGILEGLLLLHLVSVAACHGNQGTTVHGYSIVLLVQILSVFVAVFQALSFTSITLAWTMGYLSAQTGTAVFIAECVLSVPLELYVPVLCLVDRSSPEPHVYVVNPQP